MTSDDPSTATANDPTKFVITSQSILAMTKTFVDDNGGALLPGDTVTYTLTVNNTLGSAASSGTITVTDTVPGNLSIVGTPSGTGWT